jgi:hypothetical protein
MNALCTIVELIEGNTEKVNKIEFWGEKNLIK